MSSESAAFVHSFLALERNSFASYPFMHQTELKNLFNFQAKLRMCLSLLFTIFLKITFSTETHTKIFLEVNA